MIFVVIIYAGNILTGKALNDLPPFTIAFSRLFVAFLVILPIGFRSAWKHRKTFMEYKWPFLLMTLTGVTFFNTFIYGSLQFTTATNVSVLEASIPVVTVMLSAAVLKERLRLIQWLGVLLSFIGAIWVVMDGKIFQLLTIDWNIGDGIMVGAILSWSIYSIAVKQHMHRFPTFGSLFVMMGLSVIILLPVVLVEWFIVGIPSLGSVEYIAGFLYLGIFPSLVALVFYNIAVEKLGASKTSVFLNFLPLVTMVGAFFWLGETITIVQVIGSLIVIVGVIITTQGGMRESAKNKEELEVSDIPQ